MDTIYRTQEVTTFPLYLSAQEFDTLYRRSDYIKAEMDFQTRDVTVPFNGDHLTFLSSHGSLESRLYNVHIPDLFPVDAEVAACFITLCAQTQIDFALLPDLEFVYYAIVADYFQISKAVRYLFYRYIVRSDLALEASQYLTQLLSIFGPNHNITIKLLGKFAFQYNAPVDALLRGMTTRSVPSEYSHSLLRHFLRSHRRRIGYFSNFRTFYCRRCSSDVTSRPLTRFTYDNGRVWPCCGVMLHIPCWTEEIYNVSNCPHCQTPYFLATPVASLASDFTNCRVRQLRHYNGIGTDETIPPFPPRRSWFTAYIPPGHRHGTAPSSSHDA